jgi:transglutaminase-like putative cysteine protease
VEGNCVATATFDAPARKLSIRSEVLIQQYNENPLDFLVADYALDYPFEYQANDQVMLAPYLALPDPHTRQVLAEWFGRVWKTGERIQTYTMLERLNNHINQSLSYQLREESGVQTPAQTLAYGSGSCRDFALLFMETARNLGLASRFVSGYLHAPLLGKNPGSTHAWTEVYLPGAGWKGFDPTTGNMAGIDHFAVAVSRLPELVPPIAGAFFGPAQSSLEVGVWVNRC